MHEDLLGYVLGSLDEEEQAEVERWLKDHPEAIEEMERLRNGLDAIRLEEQPAPEGLALRTSRHVFARSHGHGDVSSGSGVRRFQFKLTDYVVAASIVLVATILLFPAIQRSRTEAREMACKRNLQGLGVALNEYSNVWGGYFPPVPQTGQFSFAGVYGPTLVQGGFLTDAVALQCPGKGKHPNRRAPIPTMDNIRKSPQGSKGYEVLTRLAGGDYAYSFGYLHKRRYHTWTSAREDHVPLLSDLPPEVPDSSNNSESHGGRGQNTLWSDGSVSWATTHTLTGKDTNIYVNKDGKVAAGIGSEDIVLAPSDSRPSSF